MPLLRSYAAILLAIAAFGGSAHAQQNGNTYNGVHNEPAPGNVQSKEQAAGVALPPQQQRQTTHETDQLYNQLMKQEGVRGPAASATGSLPPTNPPTR